MLRWLGTAAVTLGVLAAAPPLLAQAYYTVNGTPVDAATAQFMSSNGLPPGDYWLDANGYWGVDGNPTPMGNIRGAATGDPQPLGKAPGAFGGTCARYCADGSSGCSCPEDYGRPAN